MVQQGRCRPIREADSVEQELAIGEIPGPIAADHRISRAKPGGTIGR
jgi:hypothetical protein